MSLCSTLALVEAFKWILWKKQVSHWYRFISFSWGKTVPFTFIYIAFVEVFRGHSYNFLQCSI